MSRNINNTELRTLGYVLKRTNYGEADRILNIITPHGKLVAIAKGVRKSRSKLAGGVEIFSLIDFNIHQGKSEFGIVTGAKMLRYYGNILKDFARMELAAAILKRINKLSEASDNSEYFDIVDQAFWGLDFGCSNELVENWVIMNIMRTMGEEINLYRDKDGQKLDKEKVYEWDLADEAFFEKPTGTYGANEIKMLRMMSTVDLKVVKNIKVDEKTMEAVTTLVHLVGEL